MILVALLYAILASTFIFAKKALVYAKPFFLISVRMLLAGSVLLIYQYIVNKDNLKIHKKDWFTFVKVSIFHIYFAFIFEFWALQYISALKTTIIYSSTPFIAAVISYFILHERLSMQKIIGIVIGIGGMLPVLLAQTSTEGTTLLNISLPELVLFLAVASGAYAWFIVSDLMKKGYSLAVINGIAMLIGGCLSFATSVCFEDLSQPVTAVLPFIGWLLLLILSANIIVYNFYGWLIKRYSITFITFSGFLCPSFGTIYEWMFMGGTITWHYLASLLLVTAGLYIFYKNELKILSN